MRAQVIILLFTSLGSHLAVADDLDDFLDQTIQLPQDKGQLAKAAGVSGQTFESSVGNWMQSQVLVPYFKKWPDDAKAYRDSSLPRDSVAEFAKGEGRSLERRNAFKSLYVEYRDTVNGGGSAASIAQKKAEVDAALNKECTDVILPQADILTDEQKERTSFPEKFSGQTFDAADLLGKLNSKVTQFKNKADAHQAEHDRLVNRIHQLEELIRKGPCDRGKCAAYHRELKEIRRSGKLMSTLRDRDADRRTQGQYQSVKTYVNDFKKLMNKGIDQLRASKAALDTAKDQLDYICAYMKTNFGEGHVEVINYAWAFVRGEWTKVADAIDAAKNV